MKKLNKAQVATILFGGFFIFILFLLPKLKSEDQIQANDVVEVDAEASHNHDVRSGVSLSTSAQNILDDLENQLGDVKSSEEKLIILDSLINFASSEKQPVLMADFFKEKAKILQTEDAWMQTGDIFFKTASGFSRFPASPENSSIVGKAPSGRPESPSQPRTK